MVDVQDWIYNQYRIEVHALDDGRYAAIAFDGPDEMGRMAYPLVTSRSPDEFALTSARELMSRLLWGEARGEGLAGKVMVAATVMNRLALSKQGIIWWGRDLKTIMTHPGQFDGLSARPDQTYFENPYNFLLLADLAVDGLLKQTDATHFHAAHVSPYWMYSKSMKRVAVVGGHIFYRETYW